MDSATLRVPAVLVLALLCLSARAAEPKIQVYEEVEKGLEVGLQGGFAWNFDANDDLSIQAGPGFLAGLELGYDLTWVFRIKGGFLSQHYSATATSPSGTSLPMDWEARVVWAGASLALLATHRFYAYAQAGVGYLAAAPRKVDRFEVAGSDDVVILGGGGIEYYLPLRHFSIALEANVNYLPLRGDVAIAIFPVLRYTFGVGKSRSIKPPKDRDHDGVPDKDDKCPDTWGPETNAGCPEPDTDGDGVIDREDNCPKEPGPASNSGCPIEPDTDGDGLKDKLDRCPKIPGPIHNDGCPDRDEDGIPDHIDKCPDKPGSVQNDGCPSKAHVKVRIKTDAIELREKIHFEFGKAAIKKKSFELLDQVVATLKQHPEIKKLRIEGHTDSKGPAKFNQRLSQRRAQSVVNYLTGKGVEKDRLVAQGFGEEKPIASNNTERGRSMNRRVEMIILERE
jgi:outer membrane protein OmpA-like peptidoglycan-associated protein